jgi:hypothetical protein
MTKLNTNIEDWILNHLSKPNSVFNNLPPCPYAKKAWMEGNVLVKEIKDPVDYNLTVELSNYAYQWPKKDVIIFAFDPTKISAYELTELVENVQRKVLNIWGLVALEDHPDEVEEIDTVVLNNGEHGLVLLQERSKLEEARKHLDSLGYYKYWPEDYKKDVQSR